MKKETLEQLKSRTAKIVKRLRREYPNAKTALDYLNPLQLLIATILSAQCTDKRVNIVTKELFKKYNSAKDYATVNQAELEEDIRTTGFYRNKAKNIIACCKVLVEKYGGAVPKTMEKLTELPGVGRKTANCVLGAAYGINAGVVVDTHVARLSQRLGLTRSDNPERIEQDLMKILPRNDWYDFSNTLIWHGRNVCNARKPMCPACGVRDLCPSAEGFMRKFYR